MHPEHVCNRITGDQLVGIALTYTRHGNTHTGIAYQWRGNCYLFHQAFHVDTRNELSDAAAATLGGATLMAGLALRRDRQKAIAGFLNDLGKRNPAFPYSLKYDPKARIDRTVGTLVTSDGKGLSCVTFVLAVFQTFQVRLVDAATWPVDRAAGLAAQEKLIEFLEGRPEATQEHKKAVCQEKGCMRIRPEEVAATGYFLAWPVKFIPSELASVDLLKRLATAAGISALTLYPEANL